MSRRDNPIVPDRLDWLLLIGRRLKADYDVLGQPLPAALARLLEQLEAREQQHDIQHRDAAADDENTTRSPMRSTQP
jgi:anti-sigma factor NepR-like protein